MVKNWIKNLPYDNSIDSDWLQQIKSGFSTTLRAKRVSASYDWLCTLDEFIKLKHSLTSNDREFFIKILYSLIKSDIDLDLKFRFVDKITRLLTYQIIKKR